MDDFKSKINQMRISDDHLSKVVDNVAFNEHLVKYYKRLSLEYGENADRENDSRFEKKMYRMADCNSFWQMDHWKQQKVFNFRKTNLCKDKFCNNCKKVKQAARMGKFIPLLEPYKAHMYQLTLTIPNVPGEKLSDAITKLLKGFAQLVRYLKGDKKVKGVDFTRFNYKGSIRSLETTIPKSDEYHPHLHALMVFEDYEGWRELKHENSYTYNRKDKKSRRYFSDEEILIQKVWYLIMNGEKVTKKNIDELKMGYSCRIDKFRESDFLELFKYMTKATTEYDKVISYKQFKTLYFALDRRRQIQGYGCFYGLKDEEEFSKEDFLEFYNDIIEKLNEKEKSVEVPITPTDLLELRKDDDEVTIISKSKSYAMFKELHKSKDHTE